VIVVVLMVLLLPVVVVLEVVVVVVCVAVVAVVAMVSVVVVILLRAIVVIVVCVVVVVVVFVVMVVLVVVVVVVAMRQTSVKTVPPFCPPTITTVLSLSLETPPLMPRVGHAEDPTTGCQTRPRREPLHTSLRGPVASAPPKRRMLSPSSATTPT